MNLYQRYIYRRERDLTLRDTNRRIFPFEWGLEWIGDHLAEGASPLLQLQRYAARALEQSENFFTPPQPASYRLEGDLLSFPTPTPTPYPANNTAYCRIFRAPGDRAVIVIPQWNADADSHIGLCRVLCRLGITAARLTLPYHEQRLPQGTKRADYLVSPNLGRTLHATRQAVLEVRRLVQCLQQEGYRRIAVTGTSIGSCVAFLAFAHDRSIATGVFNHVSAFFADVVWTGLSTRYVRWGLEGSISLEDLRHCWSPISPWYFIRRLQDHLRPHLLITAAYDLSFIPELSRKVFDEYRLHRIPLDTVTLPCGHYTTATFPFKYLDGWHICRYLLTRLRHHA